MLTEVFNIVGFNLTSRLKRQQKINLSKYYGFSSKVLDFDPGFYGYKSRSNWPKDSEETCKCDDINIQNDFLDEHNLTGYQVRLILKAEEELSQTKGFVRLLPNAKNSKCLQFLDETSHSDQILAAWEKRYCDNREQGRAVITRLCQEGRHLEGVEDQVIKNYWNTYWVYNMKTES